jgi:nicotinamide mononucleotide transporter
MQEMLQSFTVGLRQTTTLEFVAVAFGLISVYFILREKILGYPAGLVNVGSYVYLCFHAGLFANMGINMFYFMMSVYGWYNWARKRGGQTTLHVTRLSLRGRLFALLATAVMFVPLWWLLGCFPESSSPAFDALTTAIFIVAMWLQATKRLESWLFWIAGDILAIPLYAFNGLAFTGFQYLAFLGLAITGYFAWKKSIPPA